MVIHCADMRNMFSSFGDYICGRMDRQTDRQASRDEGKQTQNSVVLVHFVQITHKKMLILCLFGFP